MRMARLAALTAIGLLGGLGCSSDEGVGPGDDCTPTATRVCMVNSVFDPVTLTVARGTNVEWRNADVIAHTTTSNPANPAACPVWDHPFDVGAGMAVVARVVFNTTTAVTCEYYCTLHATPTSGAMRGSVIVQ